MATKDLLSKYRSISRPGLGGGSSTFSTLAKRQLAAEDLIIDNQYEAGQLSPEAYMSNLKVRAARGGVTPAQQVSLNEKIEKVAQAVNDAEVDRGYSAGEYTTDQVLKYEQGKLERMTERGSQAYIKQQQKVQSLTDKAEKEKRTQFRISENLRLSQLPDDNSETLYEKVGIYEKLSAQARIDGDNQQADVFQAQANNYRASAKRAEINDMITGARLSVSQTPTLGRGLVSGQNVSGGTTPSVSGGGGTPVAGNGATKVNTGFSGISSSAASSAMKSLDRAQKNIERLYGQREDKLAMITAYQQALQYAEGDQATQLTIAYNNLQDDLAGIDNSLVNAEAGIGDIVQRINEANAAAAKKNFTQELRVNNQQFAKAEDDLETEFSKGRIDKVEYLQKGAQLAETKAMFFGQVSELFNNFDDDIQAESYIQKMSEMEDIHQSLINVGSNLDDYEPIVVDPSGKVTNLLGNSVQPGEVALQNVRQLKDSGVWESNYVNYDGKYYRVHYPGEISDVTGLPYSAITSEDLAKIKDTAFIYKADESGKINQQKVGFVDVGSINGKPAIRAVTQDFIDKGLETKRIAQTPNGYKIQQIPIERTLGQKIAGTAAKVENALKQVPGIIDSNTTKKIEPVKNPSVIDIFKQFGQTLNPLNMNKAGAQFQFGQTVANAAGNVATGAKNFVTGAIDKVRQFFSPKEVKAAELETNTPVQARSGDTFVEGTPDRFKQDIIQASRATGVDTATISALLKAESNFNPNAKSPVGATGIAQIMPATAKELGIDPNNPSQAIMGAARYLKQNLDRFGGDINKALAAYNAGAGNVQKYGGVPPFPETQNYVSKIIQFLGGKPVQAAEMASPTPTAKPRVQNIAIPKPSQTPDPNNRQQQIGDTIYSYGKPVAVNRSTPTPAPQQNFIQKAISNIKLPTIQAPKIQVPQIQLPKVQLPNIGQAVNNVVQGVQKAAQPVVDKIKGFLGRIF